MALNKQKKDKLKQVAIGFVLGSVLGAFLPDNVNPVEIIKDKLNSNSK